MSQAEATYTPLRFRLLLALAGVLLILSAGYFLKNLYVGPASLTAVTKERDELALKYASSTAALEAASSSIASLSLELANYKQKYGTLSSDYSNELNRNEAFSKQIQDIGQTVGVLDKLSKTDKELLQKYSKVYFLNEHYVPESLKQISGTWKYTESKDLKLHTKVVPYFNDMLDAAKSAGVDLWVVSAYRSFGDQAALKSGYKVTYGSGANAFSADQGFSEHQLGTTIDFTTKGLGGGLDGFQNTAAYTWLADNAYKYGFVLSYPPNNSYYVYEPWHWRFVGEKLARDLHKNGAHFYDWDQRKIDGYLISIFD
jgi:D-alanyl-D-alanine carboxypeptidase